MTLLPAGQPETLEQAIAQSAFYAKTAIEWYAPKHIVTMVSGGRDSAACHALAVELGLPSLGPGAIDYRFFAD